jgi:hypothetical protein
LAVDEVGIAMGDVDGLIHADVDAVFLYGFLGQASPWQCPEYVGGGRDRFGQLSASLSCSGRLFRLVVAFVVVLADKTDAMSVVIPAYPVG